MVAYVWMASCRLCLVTQALHLKQINGTWFFGVPFPPPQKKNKKNKIISLLFSTQSRSFQSGYLPCALSDIPLLYSSFYPICLGRVQNRGLGFYTPPPPTLLWVVKKETVLWCMSFMLLFVILFKFRTVLPKYKTNTKRTVDFKDFKITLKKINLPIVLFDANFPQALLIIWNLANVAEVQRRGTFSFTEATLLLEGCTFSSPGAALLLVSTKNRGLWPSPTTFHFWMAL